MNSPATEGDDTAAGVNADLSLFRIFQRGERLSIKIDSYFLAYEAMFGRFVGKAITFVEVGVLHGGSLFMWREYLGPQARIIGVDLNPGALQWQAHGFEIHIGNQADPAFWEAFFRQVGPVDVLLDDGGHTNSQQIVTAVAAFGHVRDGGLVVVEDVHASYMREFHNPSPRSFVEFAKAIVDAINRRNARLAPSRSGHAARVASVAFHESIVAFHIDSRLCWRGRQIGNGGAPNQAQDFREHGSWLHALDRRTAWLDRVIVAKSIKKRVVRLLARWMERRAEARLDRHFR